MTKIYLIRHGFSDGNRSHSFTGCTDADLCEQGFKQAEYLADFLKDTHIDRIYSSDLRRVIHTIEPTACQKGLSIEKDSRLREINGGSWEGLEYEKIGEKHQAALDVWLSDIDNAVCSDGEAVAALKSRVWSAFTDIINENSDKTVIIATHATPIRAVIGTITDTAMRDLDWVANASVTEINVSENGFDLIRVGYNDYLGELKTAFIGKI